MKSAGTKIFTTLFISAFLLGVSAVFAQASAATLELVPATGSFAKEGSFVVTVVTDTEGENIAGSDIVLEYDTTRLAFNSITEVSAFSYPTKTESGGTILISANSSTGVTGADVELVQITFDVLNTAGDASVDFVTTGALTSSVIKFGESTELLTTTVGGVYTVTEEATDDDDDDLTGKGEEQPATGVFDSMNKGLLIGAIVLGSGLVLSKVSRKFYRE